MTFEQALSKAARLSRRNGETTYVVAEDLEAGEYDVCNDGDLYDFHLGAQPLAAFEDGELVEE